ncbi:hypothetical protein G3872_003038 [Shigella sonnei]|nr:hypothetical protein [Shigella sonnei]EFW0635848.1 hypothetical protein [Shigella sonnei]QKI49001.1 hypothetical protein FVP48_05765 [Escherichia coli O10:H32]
MLVLNSPGGTRHHAVMQCKCSHKQIPSPEGIFYAKKARVCSGNSMRYLHCHFYRVDFNQGL